MRGVTITLRTARVEETPEGDSTITYSPPKTISNVLVSAPTFTEQADSVAIYGNQADIKFYMPRTWQYESLKNAYITTPQGSVYEVLGDPIPAQVEDMKPTNWYLRILARKHNG